LFILFIFYKDTLIFHLNPQLLIIARLEIPASAIRKITQKHAKAIEKYRPEKRVQKEKLLITEVDGSMVPIVELGEKTENIDLRKTRKTCWKEAKLCFSRGEKKLTKTYGAIIGSPKELGKKLYACAQRTGFVKNMTYVHALGDGAPWIVDQIDDQFGSQAHFLIDFFHTCEYLAEASSWCDILNSKDWLEEKKKMLKAGESKKVLMQMKQRLSQLDDTPDDNGLKKCIRYMEKRIKYMAYGEAKKNELPIGSGEIESSHRHIVQKRLKIAGAWWKTDNANAMLQLRVARANNDWEGYWKEAA